MHRPHLLEIALLGNKERGGPHQSAAAVSPGNSPLSAQKTEENGYVMFSLSRTNTTQILFFFLFPFRAPPPCLPFFLPLVHHHDSFQTISRLFLLQRVFFQDMEQYASFDNEFMYSPLSPESDITSATATDFLEELVGETDDDDFTTTATTTSASTSPAGSPLLSPVGYYPQQPPRRQQVTTTALRTPPLLMKPLPFPPTDQDLANLRDHTPDVFPQLQPVLLPFFHTDKSITAHQDGRHLFLFLERNTSIKDDRVTLEFSVFKGLGFRQCRTAKPGVAGQSYLVLPLSECQRIIQEAEDRHRRQVNFLMAMQQMFPVVEVEDDDEVVDRATARKRKRHASRSSTEGQQKKRR